ncbi:MAG: class I SAM-dependent methyltransferase, partial [Peptostreptococcaceae bacterium]|nr:class I SAM-dependent methyltransferase [Peptostreptococcaceae bacterium]
DLPDTRKIYESNPETPVEHYINEELFNKRIKMIAEPKINFIIEVLNSDVSNEKWLDIGCGTGEILMAAKAQGFDAYGIESDEREVTFGTVKGLNIKQAFISPETKDKEIIELIKEADIVSLYNLLEHIENPKGFMEFVKENMKLGAKLVIEVPHTPSLAEFVNLTFPMITYRHLTAPQHL